MTWFPFFAYTIRLLRPKWLIFIALKIIFFPSLLFLSLSLSLSPSLPLTLSLSLSLPLTLSLSFSFTFRLIRKFLKKTYSIILDSLLSLKMVKSFYSVKQVINAQVCFFISFLSSFWIMMSFQGRLFHSFHLQGFQFVGIWVFVGNLIFKCGCCGYKKSVWVYSFENVGIS